jgi:hypothetical protein
LAPYRGFLQSPPSLRVDSLNVFKIFMTIFVEIRARKYEKGIQKACTLTILFEPKPAYSGLFSISI